MQPGATVTACVSGAFRADIADALVARGDVARAALILHRHCQLLLREAWWQLAGVLLPRLLHCQKLLLQVSHCTLLSVQVSDCDFTARCLPRVCMLPRVTHRWRLAAADCPMFGKGFNLHDITAFNACESSQDIMMQSNNVFCV